jgi:hypothetical protein
MCSPLTPRIDHLVLFAGAFGAGEPNDSITRTCSNQKLIQLPEGRSREAVLRQPPSRFAGRSCRASPSGRALDTEYPALFGPAHAGLAAVWSRLE